MWQDEKKESMIFTEACLFLNFIFCLGEGGRGMLCGDNLIPQLVYFIQELAILTIVD